MAQRVEELQQKNELSHRRLDLIVQMRQREQETISQLIVQGVDLSILNDFVSKASMAEQITQLRNLSDKDRKELWNEIEATADVFMPKSKLQSILNSHEAQLDELRRLLNTRPAESTSAHRVWNEDLQRFEEVPEEQAENKDNAAAAPGSSQRTGVELELELAMAQRQYQGLENDIKELRSLRNSLIFEDDAATDGSQVPKMLSRPSTSAASPLDGDGGSEYVDNTPYKPVGIKWAGTQARRQAAEQTPVQRMLKLGQHDYTSDSPLAPASADFLLEGEDWMLNPRTQDMLHVREESRRRMALLRHETQSKVLSLREKAKRYPNKMSFHDKMAYFTTASAHIHKDIAERKTVSAFDQ